MAKFILQRIVIIPFILVIINFAGFAFAHVTAQLQLAQTVYGSGSEGFTPVWPEYLLYAQEALRGNFGEMPVGVDESVLATVVKASQASTGLLLIAFVLSIGLGLALGLAAVRVDPPRSESWLMLFSTVGLALPSFYVGILLVGGILFQTLRSEAEPLLPVAGYGWDEHLILPVLALVIRPTMQVAQVTASLLSGELNKRYVVAARSFGHTWRAIRWDKALRNVLASVVLTIAGTFRLLMVELVLVEWLFSWPGIGRLLVQALVPPRVSTLGGMADTSVFFLHPALVALLLMVFGLYFLLADLLASVLARVIDPRLRSVEEEAAYE